MVSSTSTGALGPASPVAGLTLVIHALCPTSDAEKPNAPPPPLLFTTTTAFCVEGACTSAPRFSDAGDTASVGLPAVTVKVTVTVIAVCPAFPGMVMWMAAGYVPAPIAPGFAITVTPAGVVPLVGVTLIHAGGGRA